MDKKEPKVTVLMPVYNGEKYLREAVSSILNQKFNDFEFIIINDGSTDRTREILGSYNDRRIRLINQKKMGISNSLNKGIKLARGEYIARMDSDDISLPERFTKQVSFLELNPDITVCGTWISLFSLSGFCKTWETSTNYNEVKCNLLFGCDVAHPSVMIRRSDILKNNLFYTNDFPYVEDYELWVRLSSNLRIANIGEPLLKYRIHDEQIGNRYNIIQEAGTDDIIRKQLENIGILPSKREIELIKKIGRNRVDYSIETFIEAKTLFGKLIKQNKKYKIYPVNIFNKIVFKKFWNTSNYLAGIGLSIWKNVLNSELCQYNALPLKDRLYFFLKCLLKYGDYEAIMNNKNNLNNKYISYLRWLLSKRNMHEKKF